MLIFASIPHLFLLCHQAQEFWSTLGLSVSSITSIESLWNAPLPGPSIPNQKLRSTILTAILWNIWKRRNALVFRNEHETCHVALRRCAVYLWRHRMQNAQAKICLEDWSTFLCNR